MSQELAKTGPNVFEQYAQAQDNRPLGTILKFNHKRGIWTAGKNDEAVKDDSRFIAFVDALEHGWICWLDKKPVERRMGFLSAEFVPPKRDELTYTDKADWPAGPDGRPKDPWQFTNILPMIREGDEEVFTYQPSSRGGLQAIAKLVGKYGWHIHSNPGSLPIVALDQDSYKHKAYGDTLVPVLRIAGWTKSDVPRPSLEAGMDDEIPF